jgi:YD repeat-containing protein
MLKKKALSILSTLLLLLALLMAAAQVAAIGKHGAKSLGQGGPLPTGDMRTISYSYDDAGRLVTASYDGQGGVAYIYDAAGNLLQRSAPPPEGMTSLALPLILR